MNGSVSADNSRPYLTSFQGNNFTDYINAVFVDVRILICFNITFNWNTHWIEHAIYVDVTSCQAYVSGLYKT